MSEINYNVHIRWQQTDARVDSVMSAGAELAITKFLVWMCIVWATAELLVGKADRCCDGSSGLQVDCSHPDVHIS